MSKTPRVRFFILLIVLGATLSYFRVFHIFGHSRAGHAVRNAILRVITPVEEQIAFVFHFPARMKNNMKDKQRLLRENKRLLALLEKERSVKNLLKEKLKSTSKLHHVESWIERRFPEADGVFARVTARNSNLWLTSLRINHGKQENLQEGNAVLTMNGLAGKVTETFTRASTVMLLTHPSSYVGVRVERTREAYILSGTGSGCMLQFVPRDADIRIGDKLITSGLSATIPPGIPVGKIQSIARQAGQSELAIHVKPYVKFSNLEHVFALRNIQ